MEGEGQRGGRRAKYALVTSVKYGRRDERVKAARYVMSCPPSQHEGATLKERLQYFWI